MFITIDRYYNDIFYNKCKEALKNNGVDVREFISLTTKRWFFQVPYKPLLLNFDICPDGEERYLLAKVKTLYPNEEYRIYRRSGDYGVLKKEWIRNDYFNEIGDNGYACLFNLQSKEQAHTLSRTLKGTKIYYLGKYYNRKYRLCLCTNESLRLYVPREQILLEKNKTQSLEEFECDINYKVFMMRDRLVKFSQTPYFLNEKFNAPNYYNEYQKQFFTF